jgi:hypothetical protein
VFVLICVFFLIFFLAGCGIEDYPYLYPVPQGNIARELNSQATISIPNDNSGNPFFYNYAIYYRIYLSNSPVENSPSAGNFSNINPVLAQDYSAIAAYINSTTTGNTSMGPLFQNRGYRVLALSNGNIDDLLDERSHTVILQFPSSPDNPAQPWPYLTISGSSGRYYLYRSASLLNPRPDRFFMKSTDLTDPNFINSNTNADVVNDNRSGSYRHAYAAFFIVAVGLDTNTYSSIYSTPAFVGVLLLPSPSP